MDSNLEERFLVSVIIITYNQENYIEQAVKGVLMQEGDFDVELIIGEDFSTDSTRAICLRLQEEYPNKIRLLLQKSNQGLFKNYLSSLALAKGEFIAQLAGDDYWTDPLKLAKQLDVLKKNPKIGLVYTDADFLYEDGQAEKSIFKNNIVQQRSGFLNHLEFGGFIAPSTWLYRSIFNPSNMGYDSFDFVDESFPFILDLYQKTEIFYLNDSTTVYRKVTNSASEPQDITKKLKYYKGLFEIQKMYLEKYAISAFERNRIYFKQYLNLLNMAVEAKDKAFLNEGIAFFKSHDIRLEAVYSKLQVYTYWNEKREKFSENIFIKTILKIVVKIRSTVSV